MICSKISTFVRLLNAETHELLILDSLLELPFCFPGLSCAALILWLLFYLAIFYFLCFFIYLSEAHCVLKRDQKGVETNGRGVWCN